MERYGADGALPHARLCRGSSTTRARRTAAAARSAPGRGSPSRSSARRGRGAGAPALAAARARAAQAAGRRWTRAGQKSIPPRSPAAARAARSPARATAAGTRSCARAASAAGRFADELVAACVRLVAQWGPDPAPRWVAAVPSLRQPAAGPDFADRLAAALGLPYLPLLERVGDGPPQRQMENSSQQAANVRGQFAVTAAPPAEPGLLVDDLWFSGWTLDHDRRAAARGGRRADPPARAVAGRRLATRLIPSSGRGAAW